MQRIEPTYQPPAWLNGGFSSWSAVRIQSWWRMLASNRKLMQRRRLINQVAAIVIQTAWRNFHYFTLPAVPEPIVVKKKVNDPNSAARRIQYLWRRYCNRRIYYYFRNLILYKLQGAPAELLRTIIPNEADILDRASGVHVKFRLGGKIFPPKIYFKIFTHRPLCDVNAFAPRDYTQEKPINELYLHNKSKVIESFNTTNKNNASMKRGNIKIGVKYFETVVHTTNPLGMANWYQRDDQNNWRPISSLLIEKVEAPPWFQDSTQTKRATTKYHYFYHHDKNIRKKDVQTYRRRRKREWMQKLYKSHLLEAEDLMLGDDLEEDDDPTSKNNRAAPVKGPGRLSPINIVTSQSAKYDYQSNSFLENLEYKSQVFFEEKKAPLPTIKNAPKYINLETNQEIPFLAPTKGKYSISESDIPKIPKSGKDDFIIRTDSLSTVEESKPRQQIFMQNENLLEWSLQLDYDSYVKDWSMIGTSLPSDMLPKTIY